MIKKTREAVKTGKTEPIVIPYLQAHKCLYLLSKTKLKAFNDKIFDIIEENRKVQQEKYDYCNQLFSKLNIPYAFIKGGILSNKIYGNAGYRVSCDVDILVDAKNVEAIATLLKNNGFVHGRVQNENIVEYSREEIIFQNMFTHQTPQFVKRFSGEQTHFLIIDVNNSIMWGNSVEQIPCDVVLNEIEKIKIDNIELNTLKSEIEFVQLCLHHYKDLNSTFLLYKKGININLFLDILFYVKNVKMDYKKTIEFSKKFDIDKYIYYCLFYTNYIFDDEDLIKILKEFDMSKSDKLLSSFGLKNQYQWNVDFETRLFGDLKGILRSILPESEMESIKANIKYM